MGQIILILVGLILSTIGVVCTFDARILSKKFFSFGDQNEASMGLKIIGFFITMLGAVIIFINI